MKLTISPSEWNVLCRQLINSKINPENANLIINQHKKILADFKEKLENKKRNELEKLKREIANLSEMQKKNKIIKFENKKDEELSEKFRNEFYKIAQKIEGLT